MKWLHCLLFGFLVAGNVLGQDCNKLHGTPLFRSIKFGDRVPTDLTDCSRKTNPAYPYYTDLRLEYKTLDRACKEKYANLFTFLSKRFSFSQLSVNEKGQIFLMDLYSFFEDQRSGDGAAYKPPPDFTRLYKRIESVYGKPTRIEVPTRTDSLFIRERGIPQLVAWECNDIGLRLRVVYGARNKMLNVLHVQVYNRNFDLPPEVEKRLQ